MSSDADQQLYRIRHSAAHLLAEAVLEFFPDAKLAIGPPIDNGFYYDFELPRPLSTDDMQQIEARMRKIIERGGSAFTRESISRERARALFADQPYKLELIDGLPEGDEITTYTQNKFTDLCRGPHVPRVDDISAQAVKLLSVAGAYWRGNERNTMLQRIYGTAWRTAEELAAHLRLLEQIAERDHRVLGKQLDLFSTHQMSGPGLIYWHPKGGRIRMAIEDYWRRAHLEGGYEIVYTPHVGQGTLWETSGHLDYYQENMFASMKLDHSDYYVKPMNCPFHIMMYKTAQRSFRDLPLRWAELGTVYRYERSGVLHGLMRVRGFTQDDAHIFCAPEQVEQEIMAVLRFSLQVWRDFGFDTVRAYLATKPGNSVGEDGDWQAAEEALRRALQAMNIEYVTDDGGGAFYGPKIDLKITDALGREWQMTTVQFDFNLPQRFDMTFVGHDGKEHRPYMIHRALLGSLERFFGILIEHYGGRFPLWLAPYQVQIIPVAPPFNDYAADLCARWQRDGIRASADLRSDRMSAKIRNAHTQKYPYIAIVGQREADTDSVALRRFGDKEQRTLTAAEALALFRDEIARKAPAKQ